MTTSEQSFTSGEWQSLGSLCSVFGLRMLGLFMVLPVLSPYAGSMTGARPILIGLAMGAYPLTQTIFQVPFGLASDRFGRKPVIVFGLFLFALGSIWAAFVTQIWLLILALALQGSGAVSSVIIALVADLTRSEVRTRAMAVVGGAVGLALGLGFVLGPLFSNWWGTWSVFVFIAALSMCAIFVVALLVPTPDRQAHHDEAQVTLSRIGHVLTDLNLWRVHTGIFVMNGTMRGLFTILPFILVDMVPESRVWILYLAVLGGCGIVMFPTIFLAERKGYLSLVTNLSSLSVVLGLFLFIPVQQSIYWLILALFLYFLGFSLLEAVLPSLVTNLVSERERGTAVGLFNMSQYFGMVCGGLLGGYFLEGNHDVFYVILAVSVVLWSFFFNYLDYDFSRSLHQS